MEASAGCGVIPDPGKVVKLEAVPNVPDEEIVDLLCELLCDAYDGRFSSLLVIADHPADDDATILVAGLEQGRLELIGKLAHLQRAILEERDNED